MKRGLKFLLIADSLATLALGMLGPIYAIFVEQIGGDILDASWAFFAFTFTTGIVTYVMGKWADKLKSKEKFVFSGYLLVALGCLGYIFVYNQATLLGVQVVLGLAIALLSPAYDSLYARYVRKKEEAADWGSWEAMGYISSAIAAVIGGYIVTQFGFKALFFVMFLFALLSAFVSLGLFKSKKILQKQ